MPRPCDARTAYRLKADLALYGVAYVNADGERLEPDGVVCPFPGCTGVGPGGELAYPMHITPP